MGKGTNIRNCWRIGYHINGHNLVVGGRYTFGKLIHTPAPVTILVSCGLSYAVFNQQNNTCILCLAWPISLAKPSRRDSNKTDWINHASGSIIQISKTGTVVQSREWLSRALVLLTTDYWDHHLRSWATASEIYTMARNFGTYSVITPIKI
jgi:hypothetical protein